jgi:hypothetical protein
MPAGSPSGIRGRECHKKQQRRISRDAGAEIVIRLQDLCNIYNFLSEYLMENVQFPKAYISLPLA